MNTSILKKCLEELNKENPRKDYVIGMLETLIDVGGSNQTRDWPSLNSQTLNAVPAIIPDMNQFPVVSQEESSLANAYGSGPIGKI